APARGQAGNDARRTGDGRCSRPDPARVHGGAGGAVRLLHCRDDDAGAGLAAEKSQADRRADQGRAAAKSLPLRYPYAHSARGASGRPTDGFCRITLHHPGERAMNGPVILDRRRVLAGGGALIVSFSLPDAFAQDQAAQAHAPKPPGSLAKTPYLDSWIRIDADGTITVFTGKAEIGQGVKTAIQQIAAEELDVPFASLKLVPADPGRTANEGYTSGSNSMKESGTAIQNAAAQVRELLIAEAGRRLNAPAENLKVENGAVVTADGQHLGYGDLVAGDMLHVQAQAKSKLKDPATYRVMGQAVPRLDIPAKVTGGAAYIQDMRLPGMVHARVVRPPSYGAELIECESSAVGKLPGVVKVIRNGNFLAVVAAKEFQAIKAMGALSQAAKWREIPELPKQAALVHVLTSLPSQDSTIFEHKDPSVTGQKTIEATYTRPYQAHGSI